tara:strand:- start:1502 stop:1993 length:492 start_codon:yes stop_codon:yes gene_type:complete
MASFKLTRLRCVDLFCNILDFDPLAAASLERKIFAAVDGNEEGYELRVKNVIHNVAAGGCQYEMTMLDTQSIIESLATKPTLHLANSSVLRLVEDEEQESKTVMHMLRGEVDGSAQGGGAAAVRCRKCGSARIIVEQKQTRSADEGFTTFFTCAVCKCRWRED